MNDVNPTAPDVAPGEVTETAGAMLRRSREAQGLDLDQLAHLLKVPVRKLEALEADRHDELPGLAFVRGLAMSVARQLGLDVQAVLAALPSSVQAPQALENVSRGLATPYREPVSRVMTGGLPEWLRPTVIAPAVLLLLALLLWFAPPMRTLFSAVGGSVAETADAAASTAGELSASGVALAAQAASAVPAVAASAAQLLGAVASNPLSASAVVDTVHSAPVEDPATSAPAANVAGSVVLRTTAESWVEVRDAAGGVLLSRMLLQGEAVGLDGALPMKLKIGNADGTQVSFRGQPVELQPYTRDNIARLELK